LRLTSSHNPRIQEIRKAARSGRPTPDELIVAEGPHLLEEVQNSQWKIEEVFCTPEARERFSGILASMPAPIIEVPARILAQISGTETPQGILVLLRPPHWTWTHIESSLTVREPQNRAGSVSDLNPTHDNKPGPIVILDEIQDPGNVGTIVRSAEAFGATGIVFSQGCARVSNGKVLRAAAGSLFRMPFLETLTRTEIAKRLSSSCIKVYTLAASGKMAIQDANLLDPFALVIGNEGAGVHPEWLSIADSLSIPTARVESLNAAVACSIALFETARRRRSK
jgi:TrmH family RNA methyltransferase